MVFQTRGEKIFQVFNYLILGIFSFATLCPVLYVLAASLSSPSAVLGGKVFIFPVQLTFDSYKMLFKDTSIYAAYLNTFFYTGAGTVISITLDILAAYPLSKKRLLGRGAMSWLIAFTMWFSAGMIPMYLVIKALGLINTRMALILPFACSAYHIILLRTFFQSLPDAFEEYAKIEGAGDWQIMWKIYIPLSKAAIATVILYIAVGKWNSYFWAMNLLRDDSKMPLQVLLKNMVVKMSVNASGDLDAGVTNLSRETMVYGTMIIAMLPMVILYPFIQKYFVKGIMVGGIKG